MKKVLMGLAILPFLVGPALAGQPLTNQQLDRVTAGFDAAAIADAEGLVGQSGIALSTTATLAAVTQVATSTIGEFTSVLYKSLSAAQSSTVTTTFSPVSIPGAQ